MLGETCQPEPGIAIARTTMAPMDIEETADMVFELEPDQALTGTGINPTRAHTIQRG
jgi:hypothetical protein